MSRFSRMRPVQSLKHIVDKQNALGAGVQGSEFLVIASDAPVLANSADVQTGSTVGSIYLNVQVSPSTQAALANVYFVLYKNPGGSIGNITPNAAGISDNKRFIIHQEMRMMSGSTNEVPTTMFNGVIKLPRSYKRFGYNDLLTIRLVAPGVDFEYCIQAIYKEFR